MSEQIAELEDFKVNGSSFPDEFVSPGTKSTPAYGLQYAKAMYAASIRGGGASSWNSEQFDILMEIAQGRQSVENIRKMFGYFREPNDSASDGAENLAYIDIQVLNLAPKYLNRAIAKMMSNHFDIGLAAIDPVSVHERRWYESGIQAYYQFKAWMQEMEQDPHQLFEDIDLRALPESPDELMYEMLTNPKLKKATDGELAIQLIHEINDFLQTRRQYCRDMAAIGYGHVHCFRDGNGIPRAERVNPKYYIGSYMETENSKKQEYAGFFDFPTVSQFRKEAKGYLDDAEIDAIVQRYSNQNYMHHSLHPSLESAYVDGLDYIPVMRYYFLSQDNRVFITRKNKQGNPTIMERGLKWEPKEDTNYDKIIKNEYTTVYGGVWVVDTEYVYNYGPKPSPRSNLVDARLPIKTFSPNYYEGRVVSFLSQMTEPLFMINVAWNKIKEVLAKGWMGVQEIDFTQLESVALGSGGQKWTPRKVYKHFLQTNRLIKRSPINKHEQKMGGSAVDVNSSGLLLSDYFNAFTTGINMLEQMVGTAAAESAQQPNRLAVGVAQQSMATANMDMEYLFNADEWIYKEVSHEMLLMIQEAKRDGLGIEGFISALGQQFSVPDEVAYCDYGLFITRAPGAEEWAEFYAELAIGLKERRITHFDSAYIREIKNLKKARQILGQREKLNERKEHQMNVMNNEMAKEANMEATQAAHESASALMERQREIDLELAQIDGEVKQALMREQKEYDAAINGQTAKMKLAVEKQRGIADIIKQASRNKSDQIVTQIKEEARAKEKKEAAANKVTPKPKK